MPGLFSSFFGRRTSSFEGVEVDDLRHGDYFISLRPDIGLVIYCEVIEKSPYPEDDEMIQRGRKRGYIFGRCYSAWLPEGELGDTHISHVTAKISKARFEQARNMDFEMDSPLNGCR